MTEIVTVYSTFPTEAEAERICRQLLEERLAACANILGTTRSIYRWQGQVEQADEVAALLKTSGAQAPHLIRRLGELHSYEVPAAVVWPIEQSSQAYTDWVTAETNG